MNYFQNYYQKNKKLINERSTAWAKTHKESVKKSAHAYYLAHRSELIKQQQARYQKSRLTEEYRQKRNTYMRGYYKARHKRYKYIWVDGKAVREHRYIIEKSIGRKLLASEIVHHKDGDVLNNKLENLEIMELHAHQVAHKTRSV